MLAIALLLFAVPRRWALVPVFVSALWIPVGQFVDVGGLHFYVWRFVVLLAFVRIILRREYPVAFWNRVDQGMVVWASVLLMTSLFHHPRLLQARLGMIYDYAGSYMVFRCLIVDFEGVKQAVLIAVVLFVPVALSVAAEHATGRNWFSVLGGVSEISQARDGIVRAQASFAHPINAGTAGAITSGLSLLLWRWFKRTAIIGFCAGLLAMFGSASSGPILALVIIMGSVMLYRWRRYSRMFLWGGLGGLLLLHLVMEAPVWYVISRVKIFGSSTAWHRSELINSAFMHVGDWCLAGTDHTRAWIPYGLDEGDEDAADITSEFIKMMVTGGLGLFLAFGWVLCAGFGFARRLRGSADAGETAGVHAFEAWVITAMLTSFAITFWTVSYFDQVKVYWSFVMAATSAWWASEAARLTGVESHAVPKAELDGLAQAQCLQA